MTWHRSRWLDRRATFRDAARDTVTAARSWFGAVFTSAWSSLGSWIGTYDAVDPRNKAMRGVIARTTTAGDLVTSLPYLRNLCRQYERNNPTARAIVEGMVANVVGSGIGLEPDTGDQATDDKLRAVWNDFVRYAMVDGCDLYHGQAQAMRDVVVAGESLWRFVIDPKAKPGTVPLRILALEPEWLGDNGFGMPTADGGHIGGITVDPLFRPASYRLISPNGKTEEVPAEMVVHCFERRRALQVRGEPWLAPILTTLRQEKDLITAELEAAKNTAGFAAAITSQGGFGVQSDEKGDPVRNIEVGSILDLAPGEDIKLLANTRPSQQISPFRQMLRGDAAAAVRLGQRWLDRDVSRANYSSMRCDMLDNERLLGPVRDWVGDTLAGQVYKKVLPYLCLIAGVPMPKRDAYRLIVDGQPYVDPLKDVQAAAMAIAYGLSDYEDEAGKRGKDHREIWSKLAVQQKLLRDLGLPIVTPDGVPFTAESGDLMPGGEGGGGYGADEPQRDKAGHSRKARR